MIMNKRSFSFAGIVTKNRKSFLGIENLDHIMQTYHNYPDEQRVHRSSGKDWLQVAQNEVE